MIPKECKRLAEVDFPIAVVSKHAAREKKIFGHHPQMLNQWWARRPLAACRSMLLGLLLPDPCEPFCPNDFKKQARQLLPKVQGMPGPKDKDLRKALLKFIADFSDWENSAHPVFLEIGQGLVKAAYPEETPLVIDPFAGGGSIPLEALRLGCDTFASDLNPVAGLILKVMLEDIPRYGNQKVKVKRQNGEEIEAEGLAEALRIVGKDIKKTVEKELAEFFPPDAGGATPIAYLWARTIKCESPNCGAEIPLMRSFWLSKKTNRRRALRYHVKRQNGKCKSPEVEFEIFEPKSEKEVQSGTVTRAKATCLYCNTVLPPERVRAQLFEQRGGADAIFNAKGKRIGGARMMAAVTLQMGKQGRYYRLPAEHDYQAVWKAQNQLVKISTEYERSGENDLCPVPDEPLPPIGTLGFRVQRYGMVQWGDLFTKRQKLGMIALINSILEQPKNLHNLIAFICTRMADKNASLVSYDSGRETIGHVFNRQVLPIVWDFVESAIPVDCDHLLGNAIDILIGVVDNLSNSVRTNKGQVDLSDARFSPMPSGSAHIWFTDPPYYDAVPYADLSDFFFVWLKRALPNHRFFKNPLNSQNHLTPKDHEIVQDETKEYNGHPKDRQFFESSMTTVFSDGFKVLRKDGIGSVVFAHKTTEGWEALLTGITKGGWVITGSWPIATERPGRLRSLESAALATSVHLVCRPRPEDAPVGDWGEVLRELPNRVGDWMERLQSEGVRGADLVFACIGPALEIFSRYSKVETAEGREVKLPEFLEKVWEVVGRLALEQILGTAEAKARNGLAGALEEDSRLTALFLWSLQATNGNGEGGSEGKSKKVKGKREEIEIEGKGKKAKGKSEEDDIEEQEEDEEKESTKSKKKSGFSLVFDVVRRFAQPLGIQLPEWEGRIIETEKGVVRLLSVTERAKQLFGEETAHAFAERFERSPQGNIQMSLFQQREEALPPQIKGRGRKGTKKTTLGLSEEAVKKHKGATTLDRVHASMLLQSSGQTNALRALLKAEQDRGPDFLRLANSLSALYPKGSDEKRLLDAMLLAVPR
jgi:putative DNA methylase